MAFVVKDYGSGALGDVDSVSSTVNSYARVTAVNATSVTIDTATQVTGTATFTAGAKVLIHVSATTSSSYKTYLGNWLLANVTAVSSGVLTLDEDPTKCIPSANLAQYYVQAIAVAQYKNLTLYSGTTVTPPVYSVNSYIGGIVAVMCSDTLTFSGGHIDLADKGIPTASSALRPLTQQESNSYPVAQTSDVFPDTGCGKSYSCWENSDTKDHFLLNAGDGAAFIVARKMVCHGNSRIGNTTQQGYQFARGTSGSGYCVYPASLTPSNGGTAIGGSTILIAAKTIENFQPSMLSKYRNPNFSTTPTGRGICRCYIASDTKLRTDEGLYAYDCISVTNRLPTQMNIKNFGNGILGNIQNTTAQMSNYAKVTAINGNKVTYTGKTTAGLIQIQAGTMVMIHWNHKGSTNVTESGRFIVANVLEDDGSALTLDVASPNISTTDYACQVISIPQAKNFTLSTSYSAIPKFDGSIGGIFVLAVNDTCNLLDGKINVEKKGGGSPYARNGLGVIGNAQDCDKLPIGEGNGSIFILAKNITMNESTRIGATHSGATMFGYTYSTNAYGGCGADGGHGNSDEVVGGYGSNGLFDGRGGTYSPPSSYNDTHIYQGAHIMIVANKITGLNQAAISTGAYPGGAGFGGYGYQASTTSVVIGTGYNGGSAGAGGADRYNYWAGGGSSGWCFIYCNEVVNQNTTGTVLAN